MAPFAAPAEVVVGVSGGADSMALAWLLRGWGEPFAVVVDHGLRAGSNEEAALTLARLGAMGVPGQVVRLGLAPGADVGQRARAGRYAALLAVCRAVGRPDLFVGHHARDQAETIVLRARAGSGAAGLAGMAATSWRGAARLLRPLLTVAPERLRATLAAAGVAWVEDPTNLDPGTARGALRRHRYREPCVASGRAEVEAAVAAELGVRVAVYGTGHAVVKGPLSALAWSSLVWAISGRAHPPGKAAVARLAERGGGTLHGVRARDGLVTREDAALAGPVAAVDGAVWDGRFELRGAVPGATLGALGGDAARFRRRLGLASAVLRTLPALRIGGNLFMVPHLGFPDGETCRSVSIGFRPMRPLAGARFAPA